MGESSISKKKILVVDDERVVVNTLKKIIENFGYACKTANSGFDASKKIHEEPFDVIIADIVMPKMGGMELLRKIKEDHPDIDVLMMTGYATEYTYTEVIKEGATDYISKPFHNDEL